jgi:hypothetical protein
MTNPSDPAHDQSSMARLTGLLFEFTLIIFILIGVFFRSNWINWSQGTNLHPDEYGLTNTLTQLAIPKNQRDYFNTRISSLSPYQKYDLAGDPTENGPDNRMRWGQLPITIIRYAGELTGNTGYNEIRLLGRQLSATADTLSLLFIFLIGVTLYGYRVGLLATALSALAVMQIQQSHFMTVDNFGGLFTTIGLYACARIAKTAPVFRREEPSGTRQYRPGWQPWGWYLLFGAAFGAALASKINLLPVGGLVLVAAFISITDLKIAKQADLTRILLVVSILLAASYLTSAIIFRLAQPMSFRNETGNTGLFDLHPNPDWVESMKTASAESSGQGGGPPGEQWAHRMMIIFPLTNMVVWGMGLPLGVAAWLSFAVALWQVLRNGKNWQAHLLPLVWAGGYFLFMGTRWVKSVRYFLPIYPFLCLLAAWGLLELWKWASIKKNRSGRPARMGFAAMLMGITLFGSLVWANAFVDAVYRNNHTRIQAARWIYQNVPGPIQLSLENSEGIVWTEPVNGPENLRINQFNFHSQSFMLPVSGRLLQILLPKVHVTQPGTMRVVIANDPQGKMPLAEAILATGAAGGELTAGFDQVQLQAGVPYYVVISAESGGSIIISRVVIANEHWDEGLPMPFDGHDPFGQLYSGRSNQIRWTDNEEKRAMLLQILDESDYLVLPSQRSIWSTCRLPNNYPMTMEYYRALFDGRMGFSEVASFSAPLKLGPLQISDVGGTMAWNKTPALPLFNSSWLAAEEAFSIYDHPPVWIFKKNPDFNLDNATRILSSVDLSKVIVQSALNADGNWCPAQ